MYDILYIVPNLTSILPSLSLMGVMELVIMSV